MRYGYQSDLGYGENDDYFVGSLLVVNPNTGFHPENGDKSILSWDNGNLNYEYLPNYYGVFSNNNYLLAEFTSFQESPPDLSGFEGKLYTVSLDNYGHYSFYVDPDSLHYLDMPVATYDASTRTVNWEPVNGATSYDVRIYETDADGNFDRKNPIYRSPIFFNGETSFVLPQDAPVTPGKILAVQASEGNTSFRYVNFSRYHLRIPADAIPCYVTPYTYTMHNGYSDAAKAENFSVSSLLLLGCDYNSAYLQSEGENFEYTEIPNFPGIGTLNVYYTTLQASDDPDDIDLRQWDGREYDLYVDQFSPYTFTAPENTLGYINLPVATYNPVIREVNWQAVENANNYEVRVYPLKSDGTVDIETVLFRSEKLYDTSFNLPETINLDAQKVLAVQALSVGGNHVINFSRYFISPAYIDLLLGPISAPLEPVEVNSLVNAYASATFNDAGILYTHTASWDWGDGSTSEGIIDSSNLVTGEHSYSEAGVYRITLTITDGNYYSTSATFEYVVVYAPDSGFVTGGGWIYSPEGAYLPDPKLVGKASFGFVSRYKKGAKVPTGNTEFQFSAGNINFHSNNYEWLVVAGAKASFKGVGTINGEGSYGFMLSAIDELLTPSTDVDLFRIKIWDKENGDTVIYDNKIDADKNTDPTTKLLGGNIIIHK